MNQKPCWLGRALLLIHSGSGYRFYFGLRLETGSEKNTSSGPISAQFILHNLLSWGRSLTCWAVTWRHTWRHSRNVIVLLEPSETNRLESDAVQPALSLCLCPSHTVTVWFPDYRRVQCKTIRATVRWRLGAFVRIRKKLVSLVVKLFSWKDWNIYTLLLKEFVVLSLLPWLQQLLQLLRKHLHKRPFWYTVRSPESSLLKPTFKLQMLHTTTRWRCTVPFYHGAVRPHPGRQQVVPVVQQLVLFAAVANPNMWHARHAARQTQQVLPGAAVLVGDEQALIGCLTLRRNQSQNNMDQRPLTLGKWSWMNREIKSGITNTIKLKASQHVRYIFNTTTIIKSSFMKRQRQKEKVEKFRH